MSRTRRAPVPDASPAKRVVRLVVDAPPPAKNRRHRIGKRNDPSSGKSFPVIIPSAEAEAWRDEFALEWRMSRERPISRGVWRIEVHTVWTRHRDLGDVVVPFGDVDATVSSVMDALQKCEAIDDDVRIDSAILTRAHGERPRVEVTLVEVDPPSGVNLTLFDGE